MHDESVRQVLDCELLLDFSLLVAGSAFVVFNNLASHHRLQRVVKRLLTSDVQGQAVEVLIVLGNVAAGSADRQRSCLTLKGVLHQVFLRGLLERVLETFEADIDELLCVHLHPDICWRATWLLVSEAEVLRVVFSPV